MKNSSASLYWMFKCLLFVTINDLLYILSLKHCISQYYYSVASI